MKRYVVTSIVVVFLGMGSALALAAEKNGQTPSTTPSTPATPPPAVQEQPQAPPPVVSPAPAPTKPQTPAEKVKEQMNGTRWSLQLSLLSGEKSSPQKETVSFAENKVTAEQLAKSGFSSSNYTLTVGEDGMPVWETMMQKEGTGVVFWRGEVHGSTMRGVLSKHPLEGANEDFSFSGTEASNKVIESGVVPLAPMTAPSVTTAPTPSSPSASAAKKKKKR